ncbi:uncharacterized protein LOC124530566 [Vanessa cardui]|uniref:uncharacterized protein LOC124530566 n=1 Tax=Vanessa cardui TaxID=171605 RepID=UPI001F144813|nr:uncharacterized protein LOC124530566 [Vanessa cardui]
MTLVSKIVLALFIFLYIDSCKSENLVLGTSTNAQLAYATNVKLGSIPFTVRTKNVFYSENRVIKAISAIDMLNNKKSKAKVTAGGIGSTFTNIQLKSERGEELNYQIQIFV